jgi:membrane associated rhomboid family serine protease
MIRSTPLSEAPRLPATVGLGLLAVTVTLLSWFGRDIDGFDMTYRAWEGEPWRLVSSALPHVNSVHLLFNLYWLWRLGSLLEERYGSARTLALYALLAAGSAAAEHAVFRGGVGLSGVGYGIVGFLAVAQRHDARLDDAMDPSTLQLFGIWFLVCIGLTVTEVMPIANVAHGMGFVLGASCGWAATARGGTRVAGVAVTTALVVACGLGSSVLRPTLNWGTEGGLAAWKDADAAFEQQDYEESERLYEYAVQVDPDDARLWFNLGVTRDRLQHPEEALAAYERAAALDVDNRKYREAVEDLHVR